MTVKTVTDLIDPRIQLKAAKQTRVITDPLGMSQKVIQSFGAIGLKLEAEEADDEVNGFVNVDGETGITVGIYEADETPKSDHQTTLKKPTTVPTLATLDERITNAVENI